MIPLFLTVDPTPLQRPVQPSPPLIAQAMPTPTVVPGPAPGYPYVSLQLGAAFPNDLDGDFDLAGVVPVSTSLELNNGFNGELAVGYKWPDWRTELAVGYSNFPVDGLGFAIQGEPRQNTGTNGPVNLTTVMVNGYYDIPIRNGGELSRWNPYLGAGIGYANINAPECDFGSDCFSGGSSNAFAYQAKAGVAYRATERGFAFVEGGYLGTAGSTTIDGVGFDNLGAWRVNVGWRQGFGGAPSTRRVAATAPAAAPEPAPIVAPEPVAAPEPVLQPGPAIRGLW